MNTGLVAYAAVTVGLAAITASFPRAVLLTNMSAMDHLAAAWTESAGHAKQDALLGAKDLAQGGGLVWGSWQQSGGD